MENSKLILSQDESNLSLNSIQTEVDKIKKEIEAGNLNPLDVYIKAKYLKDITESLMKQIKAPVKEEIDLYSKADSVKFGAKFSIRNGYEILDYSSDSEYKELEEKIKDRKELLKEARNSQKKGIALVTEDADIIEPPEVKSIVEDSIIITFKK